MVTHSENFQSISETFIVTGMWTTANYERKLGNFEIVD
jgi:hypothetical protein